MFSVGDDNKLRVLIKSCDPPLPSDPGAFRQLLQSQGYGSYFLADDGIKRACELIQSNQQDVEVEIGERRDGRVTLSLSDDDLEARVLITPAQGGEPVTKETIRSVLRANNIVFGILFRTIEEVVANPPLDPVVVAKGAPAVNGTDAKLESRVRQVAGRQPKVKSDGRVDHWELGQFINVKPGDMLMIKVPATQGMAGTDVFGNVIPATPGVDLDFAPNLEGTHIDPKNPNILRAAVAGKPVKVENGYFVDTNLDVKNVDLSTGNVYFEGDVKIAGDVRAGSKVIVTGSIEIGGTVEGATVEAGGNITIRYGVIGKGEVRQSDGEISPTAAVLRAGGSIQARFITNTYAEAAGDIVAEDTVTHSEIKAGDAVIVGQDNSKHGKIIGGRTRAGRQVTACSLGSSGAVKTYIEVGAESTLAQEYDAIDQLLRKREEELAKLNLVHDQLKRNPRPELEEKMARARSLLDKELEELRSRFAALSENMCEFSDVSVTATKRFHSGLQLSCNGKTELLRAEKVAGTFVVKNGKLIHEPSAN